MYIAMNRFKVQNGSEEAFENVWKGRDSKLYEMKGFKQFHLLRGPVNEAEGYTLFASHTVWASQETSSPGRNPRTSAPRTATPGDNKPLYLGHPQFKEFSVVEGA